MQYLVFGGGGFIGTHLKDALDKPGMGSCKLLDIAGGDVYCDVRQHIELPFDIADDDVIINLAAIHKSPGHLDNEYFETNILGAENVCEFARRHGIKRMVFVSSIATYGASEDMKTEVSLPMPETAYGISKLVAEKIHLNWKARSAEHQLIILRPGVVFGKGENGNFTRLYRGIKNHTFLYPGRKDTVKACIYVKELVRFMLWTLDNYNYENLESSLYNCSYEPAYTISQIVDQMMSVTGVSREIPVVPNCIITPISMAIKLLGSPMGICPERVKKLQVSTNISASRMKGCGYDFKWTFEEALRDWFADNDNCCLE